MAFDLMIANARIIDGSGNPWFKADIGIVAGRIARIGDLAGSPAGRVIDCAGSLVAAPGFIDIHTHSDFTLLIDGLAQSKVRQGVTLELTNHCGGWAGPLAKTSLETAQRSIASYDPGFTIDWQDMAGYLERLERQGVAINSAALVGHGSVRGAVFGYEDRPPTASELKEMVRLVDASMEAGCWGMSTGIYYAPGSYASQEEIAECCRAVARRGGIHASHIRDESTYNIGLLASIEEIIDIARQSGVRSQIAHIKCLGPGVWGQSDAVLGRLESARAAGLDVTADQYPYTASGSSITGSLIPRWAQAGGREAMVARLGDPATRERIAEEVTANYERRGGPERLVVAMYPNEPSYEGRSMREVATMLDTDPVEAALDLLAVADTPFVSHVLREEDLEVFMRWDATMVGSDGSALAAQGPLAAGWPHPRNFGTFPRVLARYVRERGVISLEQAIRKMTSLPAQRLGIKDRGLLREGYWADITVFDPATVQDNATFELPLQYPSGIPYVVVNGTVVIDGGEHTRALPGRVLRHA